MTEQPTAGVPQHTRPTPEPWEQVAYADRGDAPTIAAVIDEQVRGLRACSTALPDHWHVLRALYATGAVIVHPDDQLLADYANAIIDAAWSLDLDDTAPEDDPYAVIRDSVTFGTG